MLKFAPTPKMSTYLVAWLVGDFQCSDGKADGVPIPKRTVPVASQGSPDVIDITALIAGFDPASPHGRRGEQR